MKTLLKFTILSIVLTLSSVSFVSASENTTKLSIFSKNQRVESDGVEVYLSNFQLKSFKKIGVGVATGGLIGGFGINAEFNLEPENALFLGLGRGNSYNSFNLGWKKNFESQYLSPYTKVGFGKWFNNSSGPNSATDNDILNRVLSESEKQQNKFSTNFLAAGGGLEYNQLEGELSGVNFYGEILAMTELSKNIFLPVGSIGMIYFY